MYNITHLVEHLAPPLGEAGVDLLEHGDELGHELQPRPDLLQAQLPSHGARQVALAQQQLGRQGVRFLYRTTKK